MHIISLAMELWLYWHQVYADIREKYEYNAECLNDIYPSAADCAGHSIHSPQLWNRNGTHSDFLFQRLGIGGMPFQSKISIPQKRFTMIDDELAELPDLQPRERAALYRVAREAIANVVKHARAANVRVRLGQEASTVVLAVVDDGRGFDPAAERSGHLGLRLMADLAASIGGRLIVSSTPGSGTSVTVEVERR